MTVREKQIDQTVVVVVEELQAPAAQEARRLRHTIRRRDIRKEFVPLVSIQRKHLLIDIGNEEILFAVTIDVRGVHAHAGAWRAVGAEPDLGGQPDLVPLALAAVDEQEILHGVVRDEEIHQTVIVDVGGHDAEALADRALNVGTGRHVGEGAVAVVAVQEVRRPLENAGDAVEAFPKLVVAAEHFARRRILDEAAEEQIELAVVVVVEPDRTRRPARRRDSSFGRDVAERPVAVVLVESAPAVRRHEDVWISVVVVIPDRTAHSKLIAAGDAGLVGHVGERPVAIVLVQRVLERRGRSIEVRLPAVDHEDVHPAVVVEIEERDARSHGLGQKPPGRNRVLMDPADAADARIDFLEQRGRREQPRVEPRDDGERRGAGEPEQTKSMATGNYHGLLILNSRPESASAEATADKPRTANRDSVSIGQMPQFRWNGARSASLVATFALGCCGALFLTLSPPAAPRVAAASGQAQTTVEMSDDEKLARATCSGCHNFAPPDILPKNAWRSE